MTSSSSRIDEGFRRGFQEPSSTRGDIVYRASCLAALFFLNQWGPSEIPTPLSRYH